MQCPKMAAQLEEDILQNILSTVRPDQAANVSKQD
jgi:hypothetical protein